MTDQPEKKPRSHGGGSSTGTFYKVEVRTTYSQPTVLPGESGQLHPFVIDKEWREWQVRAGSSPYGLNVPIKTWDRAAAEHGLLSQEAAEAHRWGLISYLEAATVGGCICIETRLVAVELHQQYTTREVGVTEPMGMRRRPSVVDRDEQPPVEK